MSDAQNNHPNNNAGNGENQGGDRRRRNRGGRNRNRNRKPKGEGQEQAQGEAKEGLEPREQKQGGRGRDGRGRNKKPAKVVKAQPVAEELKENLDAQADLYDISFDTPEVEWEGADVLTKPTVGITCGDLNGIGMEIIIKALEDERVAELCTPVVFASSKLASYHRNAIDKLDFHFNVVHSIDQIKEGKNNLVSVWEDNVELELGVPTDVSGEYALKSIDAAIEAAKAGQIHAIVTAPINKHNIAEQHEGFRGHTGYLAEAFGNEVLMILSSDYVRVATVTGHVPIKDVAASLTQEKIEKSIALLAQSLKRDFGKIKPTIAVLGLNPHAGEMGTIGSEEAEIIAPAIANSQKLGAIVKGPYPADGFFGQGYEERFDAVLGMYHDQVLIPFKSLAMGTGTNYTAGLSVVRTSPDHGTAMHIAGQGKADYASFQHAIFTAIETVQAQSQYDEMTANPLKKQKEKN
jgi:4-hydroxythreonine-4-phosphate dehydrogenase